MISLKQSKLAIIVIMLIMMPAFCLGSILCVPMASAAPVMDIDYPVNADAGQPINITINITSDQPVVYVAIWYINSTSGNRFDYVFPSSSYSDSNNGTWVYTIPPMMYEGTLEFHVSARTANSSTPEPAPALRINLEGPEPARPFPWGMIMIVAFLVITLIATELIFKPGIYRKTGRQKARELEEEDRKRELEEQNDD